MQDPESYESTKTGNDPVAVEAFSKFASKMEWSPNELYLDFGCGAGSNLYTYLLPLAKKNTSKIHGVDISSVMIDHARKHFSSEGVQYFARDMIHEKEFTGEEYDKIFSYHVLHWIKDYELAMKRFYDILKPGGFVGATLVTMGPQFWMLQNLGQSEKWRGYCKGYENYIPKWIDAGSDAEDNIEKSLLNCGFEIVSLEKIVLKHGSDIEPLMDLLLSLNPFLNEIPAHLRNDLRNDGLDILKKMQNDKLDVYRHDGLCFIARKPKC